MKKYFTVIAKKIIAIIILVLFGKVIKNNAHDCS